MAEKMINTRIINKHDTAENWRKATNFIPKKGEIIVYDVDAFATVPKIKIGNGETNVNDLPFLNEKEILEQTRYLISGSKNGYDFNLPNIGVKSLQIILLHDLNTTGAIEIINKDGIVISSYVPSTYFIIGGDSFTIDSSMNEINPEFWSYVSTGDFNSIYVVDEDNKKVMCSFVYEYYISSIDAISNLENSKASIEYVNNKINENIEYINDKNNEILLESKKYTDKQTQLGFTYSEEFSIVSNPISQILSEGFNGSITSIEMNTDEWDELKVTFFDSEGIDIATIMGQGTHEVSIDNVYMFRFENSGFPGNIKLILDSKTNLNTVLDNSKAYTDEKATLGISVSKIYYTDEDNEIYVFGDQYLEIPEEFEGSISEIIVSKEPGDTAPYIQVSFYDVEYNLIETIEILPESPDENGDGEFINVSREVNITGAVYVMGSDCGCSCIGTLTLINNSQTNLGEEVNKKDIKVLESAKIYADNLSDEMLEISKTYTNELQVDIKSADVDKSVYTYTFNGEKINLDLVSDFSFWSDKDANETFFHLTFDENKFILDHKYHYGYARFCNPNNLNDFIYGIIHLTDASQEFDPNIWEIVYYGYVEMTEEEFISRYPYFLISKSSEIDKYEWKPIDDILPDNNVIYKRAITKSWENQNDYIPAENEMIIYDKDELIERNYIADFIEVDNPIEIVEIINYGSQASTIPSNTAIKFKTSSSSVEFSYSLDLLAEWYGGIGIIVSKIDFVNKELYLSDTLGNIDIEDINWVKASDVFESQGYADNIPVFSWDEYEAIKHEITLIEFPSGSIKYYNYPYSLKTKIKIGDGETTVNDLPFIEQTFDDFILEDGTNLSSVLKLNSCFMDYGYNNTTETGYEGQGRDDITTVTLGYDNINKSIYSLVTGKNNINTGNDSLIAACFNKNEGKQALITGYENENKLVDPNDINSSNNVFMTGAYNKNTGLSNVVMGSNNIGSGSYQVVMGRFNAEDSDAFFVVGNGKDGFRENAVKIGKDGSLYLAKDIKSMEGDVIYPSPIIPKGGVLNAVPVNVFAPTVSATGTIGSTVTPTNRIVVTNQYDFISDKKYLTFIDNKTGNEYTEKILNIGQRDDGKTNIEFGSEQISFLSDGGPSIWKTRIENSLKLFNIDVNWKDDMEVGSISTSELKINGINTIPIPATEGFDRQFYIYNNIKFAEGDSTIHIKATGTSGTKLNRIVVVPEFFKVDPYSLVGKKILFFKRGTDEYIEETIASCASRGDGRYNIDYTIINMEYSLITSDFRNLYDRVLVNEKVYSWENLDAIIDDINLSIETAFKEVKQYTDDNMGIIEKSMGYDNNTGSPGVNGFNKVILYSAYNQSNKQDAEEEYGNSFYLMIGKDFEHVTEQWFYQADYYETVIFDIENNGIVIAINDKTGATREFEDTTGIIANMKRCNYISSDVGCEFYSQTTVQEYVDEKIGDIHEKIETTVFFDHEEYMGDPLYIVPEEHQDMISFTVEGYGHNGASVTIYFTDGTVRNDSADAENGESHTYTYTVDKPVEKISIGNPSSAFYIVEYTYYKKGSSILVQDYIDQSTKISLEKSKQYTDNAIQQAILDSWEVGV